MEGYTVTAKPGYLGAEDPNPNFMEGDARMDCCLRAARRRGFPAMRHAISAAACSAPSTWCMWGGWWRGWKGWGEKAGIEEGRGRLRKDVGREEQRAGCAPVAEQTSQ